MITILTLNVNTGNKFVNKYAVLPMPVHDLQALHGMLENSDSRTGFHTNRTYAYEGKGSVGNY